ncbi:ATP-binding protein, partial [Microcoleus sp. herbarium8]
VFADYLEIRIWDRGQPFNLEAKLHSIMQEQRDPLDREGERGLVFMYKLTDDLRYIRTDDRRNCLVMRKNLT